ncbi:MAG TPA: PH domain-containing protein [Acidimicrobiales bacterium]
MTDEAGNPLDPRARRLWALMAAAGAVLLGAVVTVVVLVVRGADGPWWAGPVVVAVGGPLGVVLARLEWRSWRWHDGPQALELRHGVVFRAASSIPYRRIQQIDLERGPLDRAFGLTQLVVHTASATTDAHIPGLHADDATRLRRHLLDRAGVDDTV